LTPEQAAESVLDGFKRAVWQELELLEVKCVQNGWAISTVGSWARASRSRCPTETRAGD